MIALLCLALLDFDSSGVVRQGGDDEGSGIGGTGQLPVPGSESGLGGTGLKPFLGLNATDSDRQQAVTELEVLYLPSQRDLAITRTLQNDIPATREIELAPLPAPVKVAAIEQFTRDSSAISISEQIQRDIESNALAYMQLQDFAGSHDSKSQSGQARADKADTDGQRQARQQSSEDLAWEAIASFFSQNAGQTSDEQSGDDTNRVERPERVQRPELPPMQRVRPVQRAGILPPRVKPLRL